MSAPRTSHRYSALRTAAHLGLLGLALVVGTPAGADDLADVYRQALAHDTAWAAARANYQANAEKGPQGLAGLLPAASFSASTYRVNQDTRTPTLDDTFRFRSDGYNVQLTQPLYRGQNIAAYQKGRAEVGQAEAELLVAYQDFIQRVAQAYFGVLSAQEAREFATAEKDAVAKQLRLAQRNFEVGASSLVDMHEAAARYDLVQAQEIAAHSTLEARREALRLLTRTVPAALARLPARLPLTAPAPHDAESWVRNAETRNPTVAARTHGAEAADRELAKSRAGHYPTLDLVAAHIYSDQGGGLFGFASEARTNQVGLQLQLPLYQGGATSSKVRESFARRDEARELLEQSKRQAARQARDAHVAVVNGITRIHALEQALTSNQRALESTVLAYEKGQRTGIDVLNAQTTLFRARRDLSQARHDYLVDRLRLKAATGELNEADVMETNRWLAGR